MSLLVVQVVSEGILFGADRSITRHAARSVLQDGGQPKVLHWPNERFLLGYVGAADVAGVAMHEWLAAHREEFASAESPRDVAVPLRDLIESALLAEPRTQPRRVVVHLGGFDRREGYSVPSVWHIHNVQELGRFGYRGYREHLACEDKFWGEFSKIHQGVHPSETRRVLKVMAKQLRPFWFRQGIDLSTFNVLEDAVSRAFELLCRVHPDHDVPTSLDEWSKHVRMSVLMYAAYYEAFKPPGERFVGGGADVLDLPWPAE